MNRRTVTAALVLASLACCGGSAPAQPAKTAPAKIAKQPPEPPPAPEGPVLEAPADPDEACAQILSIAFVGADEAPEAVTRDEAAAQARAAELLVAARAPGADFRKLASEESDARARERGGAIGTFVRDEWPEKHATLTDAVFGLQVNGISDVVKAPYGYTIVRRCKVEKVHTRHILVRYQGAHNAPDDMKRTQTDARALAQKLREQAAASGSDFEALAKEHSEDGSAERGGDLGTIGRGLFVPPYEEAAFALAPGQLSDVVETKFGFHVIQRVK